MSLRNPIGVLHLIDTLDAGGAERLAVNLVNLLPRDRFRPLLCTTRRDGPLNSSVASDVERACLGRRRTIDPGALTRLRRLVRMHNIKVIHAHGYTVFLAALAAAGMSSSKLIWHIHHGRLADTGPGDPLQLASRAVSNRVDAAVTVSQALADWCHTRTNIPQNAIWYIPNFVCHWDEESAAPTLPGQAGCRIACVANIRPEKDHATLVRAMASVVRVVPNAHLLIIGAYETASPTYDHVQNLIHDSELAGHVTFLGSRNDVSNILSACDIGVLSSESEGLPLSILEYGIQGLATIATSVGQCRTVLDDGRAGIVVPPRDPRQLAEALVTLLAAPERRRDLGAKLRHRVLARYSAGRVLQRFSHVYHTALANGCVIQTRN